MITFTIRSIQNKDLTLTAYMIEYPNTLWKNEYWQPQERPAVIILPGSDYSHLSEKESEPVALSFLSEGYQAFVLNYPAGGKSGFIKTLEDVSSALWYIRSNAEEFRIDEDKIAVCGFSTGGHLASMLGTQWNLSGLAEKLQFPYEGNKPNALILAYALTKFIPFNLNHHISAASMLQDDYSSSIVEHVNKETPPTFIWQTREDEIIPAIKSNRFAQALHKHSIPYEYHVFSKGSYDLSTAAALTNDTRYTPSNSNKWIPLSINWLNDLFDFSQIH
ncbi:alpha/beta hydrolase [Bacillus dakarensis]|uniref:alpha/beta hydrolase n=1 Tax=Robertmurraya dakarensis TaxID=1926278 RepID=UPI000981BC3B|nr:alpha/beta hydrolase [Bacillus dakarensis]